jgi:hypothetical protein
MSRLTAYLLKRSGRDYPSLEGTALLFLKVWKHRCNACYKLV